MTSGKIWKRLKDNRGAGVIEIAMVLLVAVVIIKIIFF